MAPEVLEKRYGKRMEENREMYDMEDFLYGDWNFMISSVFSVIIFFYLKAAAIK